jgi:hypothetical protein
LSYYSRLCLSSWRCGFDPKPIHGRSAVNKVALGQGFLPVLGFFPVSIIPPVLHTYSITCHRRCIILTIASIVKWRKASLFLCVTSHSVTQTLHYLTPYSLQNHVSGLPFRRLFKPWSFFLWAHRFQTPPQTIQHYSPRYICQLSRSWLPET